MENNSIEDLSQKQNDENIPDIEPDFIPLPEPTKEKLQTSMDASFKHIFEPAMVKPYNQIEKPSHYNLCGSDTMTTIEKILGTEGYLGFLKGNVWKYRIRAGKKGKTEDDINKAIYYENLYNEFVRENTP